MFMFMRYMFRPYTAIFRQHIIKEPAALCTLSIVLLKYVVVIIINFGVIGYPFFLYLYCGNIKDRKNEHPITPKLIITTYFKSIISQSVSCTRNTNTRYTQGSCTPNGTQSSRNTEDKKTILRVF
jgi:hypothetical protein